MLIRESLDPALRRYPEQIVVAVDRATAKLEQLRLLTIREQFINQDNDRPRS
jgi:lipopolysaccharide biosynthesis protein